MNDLVIGEKPMSTGLWVAEGADEGPQRASGPREWPADPSHPGSPAPFSRGEGRKLLTRWLATMFIVATLGVSGCPKAPPPNVMSAVAPVRPTVVETRTLPDVKFVDITKEAGLTFVHTSGASGEKLLPETMGSGMPPSSTTTATATRTCSSSTPRTGPTGSRLRTDPGPLPQRRGPLRGRDEGGRPRQTLFGMGVAVGDYDSDGPDVYLTTLGGGHLFRNDGGTFRDVTERRRRRRRTGGSRRCFFDMENDGDLDLFACVYVAWSAEFDRGQNFQLVGTGRGGPTAPRAGGTLCVLLRNEAARSPTSARRRASRCTPDRRPRWASRSASPPTTSTTTAWSTWPSPTTPSPTSSSTTWASGRFEEVGITSGSPSTVRLDAGGDGHRLGRLQERRLARPGDRQLRQRDDRPLCDRRPDEPAILRPGQPLRPRGADAAAVEVRALLLRLRPRRPPRPAHDQRPSRARSPRSRRPRPTSSRPLFWNTGRTGRDLFALVGPRTRAPTSSARSSAGAAPTPTSTATATSTSS